MKRLLFTTLLLIGYVFPIYNAKSQNELDIEHLMDKTYRIKSNVFSAGFDDKGGYYYYDNNYDKHIFDKKGKEIIVKYQEKATEQLPEGKNVHFLNKNGAIAYTKDYNIFVRNNGKDKQLTFDGDSINIIIGQTVHRNEFGIDSGMFISDNGQYLAYYRMDQSMVGDYPLVNTKEREAKLTRIKYPMAGMASHHVSVFVYNYKTDKQICLKTCIDSSLEQKEQYLTNITFSPNGQVVYIQKLNRLQNHMTLEAYNSDNGELIRVLFSEQSNKYVEPQHILYFLPKDDSKFIYFSQRDGWQHLYVYDTLGNLIKQLTSGSWQVNELAGFNSKGTQCYFYATKDSPLENNFYGVDLQNGKITCYTPERGTHYVVFNKEGTRFIDTYSSTDVAWRTILYDNKGKIIKELQNCQDPFSKVSNFPTISIDSLILKDGTLVYTRMIKPKDFDPNKKYPVIVYVYGGPHAQLITNSWTAGAGNFLPYLATKGYIVWTMDSRGSSNRGYEFESAIWHNCGSQEIEDQMEGIAYLQSLPYVDKDRIGVDGWSYGGFMTLGLMLRNPGTFRVATAGGPVIDWKWYEVMYGERYMGTPQNNPTGYQTSSLLSYIDNITPDMHILIMQGYQDNTVVPQHSLEFIRNCVSKNKMVDYFVYTDHEHNVRGRERVELYKKIFNYYEDYLKK